MKILLAFSFIFSIINCSFKTNKFGDKNILKANDYHNNLRILQTTTTLTTIPETTTLTTIPETTTLTTIPETTTLTTSLMTTVLTSQPTSNATIHPEEYILLGFKNNTEVKAGSSKQFYAYVKIINIAKGISPLNSFTLKASVNKNKRLRFLDDENIVCTNDDDKKNDGIYKYICNVSSGDSVESIYLTDIKFDNNKVQIGPYAKYTSKLQNGELLTFLEKNQITMHNCSINNQDYDITIHGYTENPIPNTDNPSLLVVTNDNQFKNISCEYKSLNTDSNYYQLKCNPQNSINANLNNTYGRINDNDYITLEFEDNDSSNVNYIPNKNEIHYPMRSSGGLSAGGIVAIILPCVAALFAVAAVAFLLGKKTTVVPPQQNIGNNTIGISSSTNVVK